MTNEKPKHTPQAAVWFFIAATFTFASTALFIPDADSWLRITTLIVGLILVILGGFQLGRELRSGKR